MNIVLKCSVQPQNPPRMHRDTVFVHNHLIIYTSYGTRNNFLYFPFSRPEYAQYHSIHDEKTSESLVQISEPYIKNFHITYT